MRGRSFARGSLERLFTLRSFSEQFGCDFFKEDLFGVRLVDFITSHMEQDNARAHKGIKLMHIKLISPGDHSLPLEDSEDGQKVIGRGITRWDSLHFSRPPVAGLPQPVWRSAKGSPEEESLVE